MLLSATFYRVSSDEPQMAKTRGFTLCRGLRDSFLADIAREWRFNGFRQREIETERKVRGKELTACRMTLLVADNECLFFVGSRP